MKLDNFWMLLCFVRFLNVIRTYFEVYDSRINSYELKFKFRFSQFLLGSILTNCAIVYILLKKRQFSKYIIVLLAALVLHSLGRLNYMFVWRRIKYAIWKKNFENNILTPAFSIGLKFLAVLLILQYIQHPHSEYSRGKFTPGRDSLSKKGAVFDEDLVEYSLVNGETKKASVSNLIDTSEKLRDEDHEHDTIKVKHNGNEENPSQKL